MYTHDLPRRILGQQWKCTCYPVSICGWFVLNAWLTEFQGMRLTWILLQMHSWIGEFWHTLMPVSRLDSEWNILVALMEWTPGVPDGIQLDTEGNIYTGCADGTQVLAPSFYPEWNNNPYLKKGFRSGRHATWEILLGHEFCRNDLCWRWSVGDFGGNQDVSGQDCCKERVA